MEPSQITGDAEECRSNESGWTMYIGSSIDDADDNQNEQNDDNGDDDRSEVNHEADSDDSMISDASSGPSHQGNQLGNAEGGYCGFEDFKHDEHELYKSKHCIDKRAEKPKDKQENVTKIENEDMNLRQKKAKGSVQTHGDKVRKNLCLGNRK